MNSTNAQFLRKRLYGANNTPLNACVHECVRTFFPFQQNYKKRAQVVNMELIENILHIFRTHCNIAIILINYDWCYLIIDCTHIYEAEYTAPKVHKVVSSMIGDFEARQQKLHFFNLKPRVALVLLPLCQPPTRRKER
uniref:Uncharacterized protein n=1 Tax=Glossina brevipalpis TaxID=37001 RepID=A0A1A9W8S9_9MUSC